MRHLFTKSLCIAAMCFWLAPAVSRADDVPSEKRLPPNVMLHVSVPDFPNLQERMKDTSMGMLINDPELEKFRAQLLEKFNEVSAKAEAELGFPLSDLQSLLAGEISVSVVRPIGQPLGVIATLDIGDHKDVLDQLLAKIDTELKAKDAEKETDTLDGTEITFYSLTDPDAKPGTPPLTFAYFLKDEIFVVGSSISLIESTLDRWNGQHPETFADSKIYNTIITKCSSGAEAAPVIKWFVNPVDLSLAAMSMAPETQMASAMAAAYLPTLGLNKFKAMGGAVEIATKEFDSISRTMMYVDRPTNGLLKVFEFPSTISGPPAWVPATAGSYFGFHWDLQAAYFAIETIVDTFSGQKGQFEKIISNAAKRANGPDLHPKKDVIDVIDGVLHGYLTASAEGEATPISGVIALGVRDEEKAVKLVEAMGANAEITKSELRGVTIYNAKQGAAAIHNGMVYFSEDAKRLETALFGDVKPLTEDPAYQKVAANLPANTSILTYSGNANQWAENYNNLRDGKFDSFTEGEFDFSVLPPFEVISPYILPSTSYTAEDENGAIMVQFTPRKE